MSALAAFSATQFRHLDFKELQLSSGINLITGPNGSGKTALLEAIYHLSAGHSFRTKLLSDLISHGKDHFVVRGMFDNDDVRALKKTLSGQIKARLNHVNLQSIGAYAKDLPILLIYQDIFQIIDCGPTHRRMLLDWGLFHVEHDYFDIWRQYKKALSQRNALLKSPASYDICLPWTKQLIAYGHKLDKMRSAYFEQLSPLFNSYLKKLSTIDIELSYKNGLQGLIDKEAIYALYDKSFNKDNQYGYTQYGPHKADIHIKTPDTKVKNILSRGQQKMILLALKLAQSKLLKKPCIYLLDDISAEMDRDNLKEMLNLIREQENQVFMTDLDPKNAVLGEFSDKKFHVKHGRVSF